jgi:hypothetical protein
MFKQLVGAGLLVLLSCGVAQAVPITFYDNLANLQGGGFFVGPRPSASPGFAVPFLATASADLTQVTLILSGLNPSNAVVRLLSDDSTLPGSPISALFTLTGTVGDEFTFEAPVATTVSSGIRYWLEVSAAGTDTFTFGTSFASGGNSGTGYLGNLVGVYADGSWTTSSFGQDLRARINAETGVPELDSGRAGVPLFMAMLCLGLAGGRRARPAT